MWHLIRVCKSDQGPYYLSLIHQIFKFSEVWEREHIRLTLAMLNKLRCHAHFKFWANQITYSRLLIKNHILNGKQYRSRSVPTDLDHHCLQLQGLIPGSAGPGLNYSVSPKDLDVGTHQNHLQVGKAILLYTIIISSIFVEKRENISIFLLIKNFTQEF